MGHPLLIGITQRVYEIPERNERRDTLDQAWTRFFKACNLEPLLIPNCHQNPTAYATRMGIQGIVLTGGNNLPQIGDLAPERDDTEIALLRLCIKKGIPLVGVCRGMQLLNLFYGGNIVPVQNHVGCYHDITSMNTENTSLKFSFDKKVNSFHDFGIISSCLSPEFEVLAQKDDVIEAFVHHSQLQLGIMWHPERNADFSQNDINIFRTLFKID